MTEAEIKHDITRVKADVEWLVWVALQTIDAVHDEKARGRIETMAKSLDRLADYAGCTHLHIPPKS
jgi:hypothetical protein